MQLTQRHGIKSATKKIYGNKLEHNPKIWDQKCNKKRYRAKLGIEQKILGQNSDKKKKILGQNKNVVSYHQTRGPKI